MRFRSFYGSMEWNPHTGAIETAGLVHRINVAFDSLAEKTTDRVVLLRRRAYIALRDLHHRTVCPTAIRRFETIVFSRGDLVARRRGPDCRPCRLRLRNLVTTSPPVLRRPRPMIPEGIT